MCSVTIITLPLYRPLKKGETLSSAAWTLRPVRYTKLLCYKILITIFCYGYGIKGNCLQHQIFSVQWRLTFVHRIRKMHKFMYSALASKDEFLEVL